LGLSKNTKHYLLHEQQSWLSRHANRWQYQSQIKASTFFSSIKCHLLENWSLKKMVYSRNFEHDCKIYQKWYLDLDITTKCVRRLFYLISFKVSSQHKPSLIKLRTFNIFVNNFKFLLIAFIYNVYAFFKNIFSIKFNLFRTTNLFFQLYKPIMPKVKYNYPLVFYVFIGRQVLLSIGNAIQLKETNFHSLIKYRTSLII
jgi:hypothetical protein